MERWKLSATLVLGAILGMPVIGLAGPVPPAITINPNYDLVVTRTAYLPMGSLGLQAFEGVPLNTFDFGGTLGVQNVGLTDTIIHRNSGGTLNASGDSFTTSIDVVAVCLRSVNQLDLGAGSNYYYATLDAGTNGGTMEINGDGTWSNDFTITVGLHRGSKSGPKDLVVPKHFLGRGLWDRVPGPFYPGVSIAVTYDPEADGEFFLLGPAVHEVGDGTAHTVIDITHAPEPSTGLLLLAGGLAMVWRKRKSRIAV
jgi:hypothetical protein